MNIYGNNLSSKTVTVIGEPETHFQMILVSTNVVPRVKTTKTSFFIPQSSLPLLLKLHATQHELIKKENSN